LEKPQVFSHESFGDIPVIVLDGEEWFGATEIASILGFNKPHDAVSNHVDEDDSAVHGVIDSMNRKQSKKFINESGMYSLIFGAARQGNNLDIKERAKKFKRWVTSDVLPSIRKNGIYATDNVIDNILNNPDFGIELLTKLKEERAARVKAEQTNAILMHVNKTYTATEVGKELGFKSAIALNKDLEDRGVQFKVNGTWVLGAKYSDCGYTEIKQTPLDNGKVVYDRRFTQLGREWLLKLYEINVTAMNV
jgi:prophage antirepressor-like protein